MYYSALQCAEVGQQCQGEGDLMQLCALDEKGQLVRASSAHRHVDYSCLECGHVVRLRKGAYRQPHYFHIQPNRTCRLSGKGLVHLSVQNRIVELLPSGEADMEYRFEAIGRVADVAWIPQKIVFEIQCAAITAEEVMARNRSYASVGFDVVWILHSDRYNKQRMTSAEDILKTQSHYYTDIDSHGKGAFFDQYALVEGGRRIWRFPSTSIDLTRPFRCAELRTQVQERLPVLFLERYRHWTRGFAADYLDSCRDGIPIELAASFEKLQQMRCDTVESSFILDYVRTFCYRWIIYPYQVLLRHILEKASR